MIKRALACLSVALFLAGCAGSPLAAPKTGTISGHVSTRACGGAAREDSNGCKFHPAAGVTLAFRHVGGGDAAVATTDAGGFYAVTVPAGQYEVSPKASVPGVKEAPRKVTVPAGGSVTADFSYTIQLL